MKRILITGASGFIGSTLVDEALNRGWEVTAAVRPTSDKTYLQDPRIHFLELNFTDSTDLKNKLHNAGRFVYVLHGAGSTKAANKQAYLDVNAGNTQRFTEILREDNLRPEKFLFVSSLAAMGPTKRDNIIKPTNTPQPITGYGESKLAAEQYLVSLTDFPWVALQPAAVYGPREREILIFINLINKGWELYIGTKPQQLAFIYSKDLVTQMLLALEHGHVGKKYLSTDGKVYSMEDLATAIRVSLNKKTFKVKIPLPIVSVIANVSEVIGNITGKATILNREKMRELGAESWICDMSETFTDLKFTPQYDLFSGMKETIEWYKKQGWL